MVYFVGAGTGAVDLITVRGARLLSQADVIVYAGSLVNPELLTVYARKDCEIYDSAKLTLEEVIRILSDAETAGKTTVRLHTGDPSIYGAVREQMDELDARGISYESCPGVSACFGAAASLNLEYTLPGISQSLIITRMEGKTQVPELEKIERFAVHRTSMAIYLSAGMIGELSRRLIEGGYEKSTPAALVYKATWDEEEAYVGTVETLYDISVEHGITKTALILVGDAIAHRHYQKSRLYAADFSTGFRKASAAAPKPQQEKSGGKEAITGKVSVISFTEKGRKLSEKIAQTLIKEQKAEVSLYTKCQYGPDDDVIPAGESDAGDGLSVEYVTGKLTEWVKIQMQQKNALLFIGACGIAVRAIAPFLTDKLTDVPVLVMDEMGGYVIPILSGHVGGANALAKHLAMISGAEPVITTATDLHGKFAVDLFAKKNGLSIENREGIAKVSAKVLAGKEIAISIEPGHEIVGKAAGIRIVSYPPTEPVDVVITSKEDRFDASLILRPKEYALGIGCKRGKAAEEIERLIAKVIEKAGISGTQIFAAASVSQKQGEQGILTWCRKEGIPFFTYTAEELQAVNGKFTESAFVKDQVGVANVCERAAVKACGEDGELVVSKVAENGITAAIAKKKWKVCFDGE